MDNKNDRKDEKPDSFLRKIAKFYTRHKTFIWYAGWCTTAAYGLYKVNIQLKYLYFSFMMHQSHPAILLDHLNKIQ